MVITEPQSIGTCGSGIDNLSNMRIHPSRNGVPTAGMIQEYFARLSSDGVSASAGWSLRPMTAG